MPNLRNPVNGQVQAVADGDADALRRMGWTDEMPTERVGRLIAESEKEYYTSGFQGLKTVAEGALSGATLGLSDLALDSYDAQKRAEYNPGLRTGAELVGAIAPALLSDGASAGVSGAEEGGGILRALAGVTPAGALARGGTAVRESIGGLKGAMVAGGLEGAAFGAGGALSRAQLSDEPLTVESAVASIGHGLLLGAGAGLIGGGLIRSGEKAEEALKAARAEAALTADSPELRALASTSRDTMEAAQKQLKDVAATLKEAQKAAKAEASAAEAFRPVKTLNELRSAENEIVTRAGVDGTANEVIGSLRGAFAKASRVAASEKDLQKVYSAVQEYHSLLSRVSGDYGVKVPELSSFATTMRQSAEEAGKKYADSMAEMSSLPSSLKLAPRSPSELAAMGNERATQYFNGLRTVIDSKNPALQSLSLQVKEQVEAVTSAHGIVLPEGAHPVEGLEALRSSLQEARKLLPAEAADGSAKSSKGLFNWLNKSARLYAARAGEKVGGKIAGKVGSALGREAGWLGIGALLGTHHPIAAGALMAEAIGMSGAVRTTTQEIMARVGKTAGRGAIRLMTPAARLSTSLFGAPDKSKDIRELAFNRAREAMTLAQGSHRDLLYAALGPVIAHSQTYARAIIDTAAKGIDYLASVAPRDPGGGGAHLFGKWDRGWLPSRTESLMYAAVHEAVVAPMDAIQRLGLGNYEPAAADALWNVYPSLMAQAQAEMVYRLSAPDAPSLSLGVRSSLSTAFRIPLDGLVQPTSIAALQSSYLPQPDPAKVGSGDQGTGSPRGSGRPAATEMTHVQQLQSQ